ncbi:glycoside hydrolase family 15 protein [Persicimonas caeni]|uniref:Glycoside hydrolase family 15 protein n=1 Tax=Persicimonas caeni TaxID=2292766 RepID=A0A4Y6PQF4_PERCE|nr:glycoside hydrolase family 15 protein [Persicimonas caeni]QDG50548.1 glycoside hydrolase family 15 protein [Persicimonas caeni]QED31769.1 glycoside hydrolase family 15 protein [Persicimonas caeni]
MTSARSRRYCPITEYGIIGDMKSAALVAADGSIDWCCWPRFDSSPVFHRLLDADDGGFFCVQPCDSYSTTRRYVDGTNVLETRFTTEAGEVVLTDFMPVHAPEEQGGEDDCRRIVRRLEGVRGRVEVDVLIAPTFDWGRTAAQVERRADGIMLTAADESVVVDGSVNFEEAAAGKLRARCVVGEGDEVWVSVAYSDETNRPQPFGGAEARRRLDETVDYWRGWMDKCAYEGPCAGAVRRSALVLKLLTYAPTGAVIAAPTTSLPEEIGGVRNWDYRYVWLRDAGLILESLQHLGYHDEAMAFWDWLEDLCLSGENQMQNIYRVDGTTELPEQCLDHLEGYEGSQPVRIGNSAVDQLQLDRFGQILDAGYICQTEMREPHPDLKPVLGLLADQAAERWHEPDHGIWEMRSEPRHLVHSKLMCWVALDRALRLNERGWLDGNVDKWRDARQEIREAIEERGFNAEMGAFTQTFDGDALDASTLLIPLVGFLEPDDPRVHSTIDCIQDELMEQGLVQRYRTSDGLPGEEGAFVLCSFWLVSALATCGRRDEARELFGDLVERTNDLGLLAEEVTCGDVDFLGNFPQGFSHLALIDAAHRLAT